MSEKSRQFLHGEFVKAGLNVGTAEEFDSLMVNNAESRNWAKAQAERLGFDTTDFDRKMTDVTITPTNENVAVSDTTKPTDTPAQILARTKEKATSNNGGKLMAMPVTNMDQWQQEADIKARQAVASGKASAVQYVDNQPISWEEMQQSTNPYVQKMVREHDRRNKSKTSKIEFNPINKGVLNEGIFNIDEDVNLLTGEKYYYDKLGFEHDNIFSALDANDRYRAIDKQMHYKRDYINSLDQRIADTENKIKEVQAEQAKKTSNVNKGASAFMPASARTITETQTAEQLAPQETEELKQLHATLKDLHDMKTTVQVQNELIKSDGFFDWNNAKNIWRGLSDTFTDPYFYSSFLSFGATDLTDAQTKAKVFDKIEKGQELTDTEMQLALASGMADDIKSSADLPIGYTGAKIAGESLPFILQMAFNPATGLAKGAAKAVARKVGRSGLWAVTARVGARALGATAEGAVLANTIQAGATAADIIDRKTGKVKLGFDENGYLIPTEIDDKKSWGQAIYEGEASKIIENATELMGLPGMSKLTKATAKGLEKLGLKNVRKTINTLSRSKMSQFLERAGWHGPLGEIFEEEAGMFFNIVAQVGDNKWSDFYDIKKQSEIALGCSLFGGVVSVYTTTSAATSLALDAKAERRIKSTDAIAKGRLTESRWLPIKEEFDNALDSEREEMVGRIMSDTSLQPQEKKAVLDYFSAAVYWEGRNQAKAITALESKPTPTQRAINATEEAYQQGMLADNPSDQYDAMEQLRTAEQKVRDYFGWDGSIDVDDEIKTYFGTSDQVALLEQLKDYNDDVQDLFADYLFARTKYDGVIEGQAQRVEAGVAELTERLSSESHAARQEMVSATLPDGTACTIVGGNFELTDDGRIDTEKSDQTVIIMRDGEKKMISADQVGNVTTMPIEQVINEQVTAYRQQADIEFENGIIIVAQSRQQAEAAEQQQAQAEQAEQPTATEEAEQPQEQQPSIPVDAKGNPLYEQATPELVVQDIYNNQGLPADIATQFVDNKLEEAKKIAEKLAKKEPKIGTNIAQYKEAMAQWQQATTEAQSNIAFWKDVKAAASQRNQPTEETAPTTEETAPVVEIEEQAEETTEAEQPTEETAKEVTLETEEVAEEQTPIAESATPVAESQAETTQSVAETQAEITEEQSAEEGTPQVEEEQAQEEAPQAEQTEVAEETSTEEQPSAETAEEQPQAEQTEEVTEEYIGQVINSLAGAYDSFANEAQKEVTNNLDSFKAELSSRTDEEIATAITDIESTPDLVELFERVRNGLLSGEIKRTEQEEQDLVNALQRIAQGNVAKDMLLPIFKAEQQKRAEQTAAEDARRKPLRQRAKEWEQKTGTKVVIVEDETEIEQESALRQVAESKVMGWYNRKSGEVYLYMPNLISEEDIDNTFIHEVVIHKGLRGLLKPQAYNSVMQRVFDSLSPEQQAKWLKYPGVKGDAIKAADEYIANTFESLDVENASLWQKFVDAIRTALINMGINLKVSDATLGSLIRQSYRKMAEQKAMEIPTEMIEVANDIPADASAETSFSIKIAHTLNEKSMEYAQQKEVSEEFMDALRKAEADINQMAERISQDLGGDLDAKRRGKRMLPEEVNVQDGKPLKGYSTIFKNGSYGRTMENTLKCLRTLAYIDFVNDVKERIGRPLTSQESFLASQMLYDISVDPQCLYCYVSLDRKAYDEFLIRYLNQRDAVIAAYDSLSAKDKKNPKIIDELYQDFLASRKDTKEMKRRFNMWIDARKAGLPLLSASDVATTTRRDNLRNNGDASLKAQLKDAEAYAQGASWAKKEDEYRAYTGEILRMPQSTINMLNKEYGLRFYSFSEYSPAFIVENMQMIRDAAIRGLRGLAYTKETDFVKIFAPSQININVSVFGRRDANGNMVADTRQGADWAEAKTLREQYPNVGAVFVATNDADVEWALAQDWIDVVIPFHIVRTGADIANFYEWVNYSSEQADKDAKGRKADISPVEHLNSKERYMQLVEERNLTPRFAKWSDNPNYMKLVNETRRPYNQTPTLTPSFMLNEALTSWNEFNEKGGYYGGWYNVDEQGYQDAVAQVTEDIQEGRTAKDVDYGRQDVPADAWNTKRQTREQRVHHNAPLTNASEITQEESANDEDIAFSVRESAPPKKTQKAYAVFVVNKHKDGKVSLHPKMISGDAVGAPPLTWLNADTGKAKRDKDGNIILNTLGRAQVNAAGGLAWRPGKHLAPYPNSSQFKVKGDTKGVRDRTPDNIIYFEVEYAADNDYQIPAWEYGVNKNGIYQHTQAGLPYIPEDGYYVYRTNANPDIPPMIITGAYRITRALTDAEAKELNQKAGGEWFPRKSGNPVTEETLKELGLDEKGLQQMADDFDFAKLSAHYDESDEVRNLPGYVRRPLNFADVNLQSAIAENTKAMPEFPSAEEWEQAYAPSEDIAFSVADDALLFRPEEDAADTADTFTSAAEVIAQQLGVEIEIDESMPAKGSYNPRTGRIRINPSRHATAEDVQRTVLHETIGHGGIQAVAGQRFGQVCQQVYGMMSEEQRADIRSRHGNLSDEAVGAEYIAEMAEKGKVDITTWEKVKAMVRNMLMSMGINLNLTDADIRYMLYSAHQLAEKGKLQDAINRATTLGKLRRQAELSHDVAEDAMSRPLMRPIDPDLIELTTGELGLTDVQVIDADTLEKMFDSTKLGKANKHSIFTQFKNNFIDRTRPVAKFIQQVYGLKNIGEAYVWNPEENPHIGANLAPSKAMRRTQVFRKGMMKDLLDTYNNLWMEWRNANRGFGVEYAQAMARLYAIAKTAQERQTIKGKGKNDTDFAGVAGVLKWIGMTVKVYNGKFLKPINWEAEASALGKDHDELTIAECNAILVANGYPTMAEFIAEFEKGVDVKEFWNMTQTISHDMLRNQLEAGLLSPTSYQILMYGKSFVEIAKAKGVTDTNMLISMAIMTDSQQLVDLGIITQDEADALTPYYQHYLPLKDSTDIEQTDVVDYGGNRKVEGSKRAVQSVTGHSNMVGDPIARLCYDYTVAIHNEEENKWKLQLLDIVRYHQSTTPPKKRMAVATSRKYINGLIGAFDEVRINPHAMSEHEVAVFENGSQVVIRFADKSIAEAVNPEKVKVGKFLQTLNKFNRFLANAYTSKNPAFVVPNVIRDYQAGFQYNLAKGKKQWMIYHKMMANARSRQALYDLLINRENHSAWGNTKYADYVQEFLDNGGPTAVNQMASLDNIQDELNKTAKAINEAKTPLSGLKKGARAATEWLGRMGEMAELTTRLATYIAARECGKSVSLAALEAKEVSVNFDRKGKASIRKYFPLFSIFQNAALQSLRREMGLMREAPWTYTAYRLIKPAMHIGLSIYVGMIINGIDGDDEEAVKEYLLNYFSVNSHTASANFLIPTSKGITFSIPAAIDDMGFNKLAFLITKRVMLNSITGHAYNAEESDWDDVIEVVSQFADMAGQNPLTVGLSTLTPAFDDMEVGERVVYAWSANPVFSPFIQTGLNRDYKGEKFYGEPIVDQGRPRNYYDWNKNSFGHSVAKLLSDATGGNDAVPGFINIQGAAIDLFLSSYLGGYGDFASKTLDTGKNAGELLFGDGKVEEYGKEKEIGLADVISDLPVAYRFAKAPIEVYGEIGVKDHVVRLKNKANEWERQIVNQYKDGYIEEAQEMLQDGNGSAQDYYLSIGRSKIYEWSKDIPNAKTLYEDMMSETYHNGEYSTLGQAAIIIGQAEMFSSLIKGNFDDLENPNDASYLYEDIKKYYLPTMKEILKEAEPEEANAEIEAIAQEIVDYYNELGNPTPHTKDTKLFKYEQ